MGGITGFYEARTDRVLCVRCAGTPTLAGTPIPDPDCGDLHCSRCRQPLRPVNRRDEPTEDLAADQRAQVLRDARAVEHMAAFGRQVADARDERVAEERARGEDMVEAKTNPASERPTCASSRAPSRAPSELGSHVSQFGPHRPDFGLHVPQLLQQQHADSHRCGQNRSDDRLRVPLVSPTSMGSSGAGSRCTRPSPRSAAAWITSASIRSSGVLPGLIPRRGRRLRRAGVQVQVDQPVERRSPRGQ